MTTAVEKSYLPQYIYFQTDSSDRTLDSPNLAPKAAAHSLEVVIDPTLVNGRCVGGLQDIQAYQMVPAPIYPSLLPPNKNCTSKTPLIPKAKVKCAPSKTNWLGII